jgi:hypothetical protein
LSVPIFRLTLAAALAAAALAFTVDSAAATTPCGQAVLDAWGKGTLGSTFPVHCYQNALQNLPADVAGYSDASDDIHLAMLAAIRKQGGNQGPPGPSAGVIVAVGGGIALLVALLAPIGVRAGARAVSSRRAVRHRSGA